jgi:twitching motility protein PilT
MPILTDDDVDRAYDCLLPRQTRESMENVYDLDFAYEIPGVSRFRINLTRQLGKNKLVIRLIPYYVPKVDELNLPSSIEQFATLNNGLVLVTGPTGAGKSTTIASLIDYINTNYSKHIITIEDPIEFIFNNKKCIISQRQILLDTASFPDGVKYALRQDPDVVFIGEVRDRETISAALKAAETGHLVLATIHTNDAVQTVNRIINMFEPSDRDVVRSQLASLIRGTISQKLVPLKDGSGRRPACEVLVMTPTVKEFIEKDEMGSIYDLVKKGSFNSMITMNMSLYNLYANGFITEEVAMEASDDKPELAQMIKGVYAGSNLGGNHNDFDEDNPF